MGNNEALESNQRNQLQFFIEEADNKHKDGDYTLFYIERGPILFAGTELYMEGCKCIYYIYPLTEHSGYLFLYLGDHCFDEFYDELNKYTRKVAKETWPLLMEAIENGDNQNTSDIALSKIDAGDFKFWGSLVKIENIDYSDLETEYIGYKAGELIGRTCALLQEYINNDLSSFQQIKIAAKVGKDIFVTSKRLIDIASYIFGG